MSGIPLNCNVEDLFGILIDSTVISEISASGCGLTGTLTDGYPPRQGSSVKIKIQTELVWKGKLFDVCQS